MTLNESIAAPRARDRHATIIELARAAHADHWRLSGNESEGDRRAATVTRVWQKAVTDALGEDCLGECVVGGDCRQKIDLVDLCAGIAYELKVSPNNAHFEFYRDIFKVLAARESNFPTINRFVFITPEHAARKLRDGLGRVASRFAAHLRLDVEIAGI